MAAAGGSNSGRAPLVPRQAPLSVRDFVDIDAAVADRKGAIRTTIADVCKPRPAPPCHLLPGLAASPTEPPLALAHP